MTTPIVEQVIDPLRKRIKNGDLTLNRTELKRVADMLDKLATRGLPRCRLACE